MDELMVPSHIVHPYGYYIILAELMDEQYVGYYNIYNG